MRQTAKRRCSRRLPESALLEESGEQALQRLEAWLAEPAIATRTDYADVIHALQGRHEQIAAALLVLQRAGESPELQSRVNATVSRRTGPFGPGDANRVRFRVMLEQSRREMEDVRRVLDPLRPQYPQLAQIVGELREVEGQMIADLRTQTPVRGPLRVAIAGRTKAGKTTLRKVLTRDISEDGIGRGAHRTTRMAEDFAWDRITFVDTPGVSAKDDDFDAGWPLRRVGMPTPLCGCTRSHFMTRRRRFFNPSWLSSPCSWWRNAKWTVSDPRRLALFARRPGLAFRDEASRAERSRQVAEVVGVREPMFIAAHVRCCSSSADR